MAVNSNKKIREDDLKKVLTKIYMTECIPGKNKKYVEGVMFTLGVIVGAFDLDPVLIKEAKRRMKHE